LPKVAKRKLSILDLSMIYSTANLIFLAAFLSRLGQATSGSDLVGFTYVALSIGDQAYPSGLIKINDLYP
jgi:hypothetical protein